MMAPKRSRSSPFPLRLFERLNDSKLHPENIAENGATWLSNNVFAINTKRQAQIDKIKVNSVNHNYSCHGIIHVDVPIPPHLASASGSKRHKWYTFMDEDRKFTCSTTREEFEQGKMLRFRSKKELRTRREERNHQQNQSKVFVVPQIKERSDISLSCESNAELMNNDSNIEICSDIDEMEPRRNPLEDSSSEFDSEPFLPFMNGIEMPEVFFDMDDEIDFASITDNIF
ncbi:hypothetical protein TRFO_31297 [Tritrichomonas foetus]|uniref:Initiator binding domain-containing protein n=1 Tax=Tritrichomonas foetus TaxID=1144522 RepID=A0A1J4JRG6_9EUKA|nr:hypothetical protein TRFO_31297 [Tritrichomonas foetus]|eukprot:OHT01743.1 hypothetical protein TRFO_31297 [Tritrichomonas foetus]